jgi:excisionase family DNA binding protein
MGLGLTRQTAPPDETESAIAREASRSLATLIGIDRVHIEAEDEGDGRRISFVLPASAVRLLLDILTQMAEGNAVAIVPHHAELTTQQAADCLNVSRPHLIKLLERNELPYSKVGTHRRIRYGDLMEYADRLAEKHGRALDELTAQAQEHGMGY